MQHVGRHYISLQGCGGKDEALITLKKLASELDNIYDKQLIVTYLIRVLYNEDVILHEGLEPEEILFFSEGKLPVVFCSISYDITSKDESEAALELIETMFELRLFKSFSIKR